MTEKTLYDILEKNNGGEKEKEENLRLVVQRATPAFLRLFNENYRLEVYRGLLKESFNLSDLKREHRNKYEESSEFRIWRPRYHLVKRILRNEFGAE